MAPDPISTNEPRSNLSSEIFAALTAVLCDRYSDVSSFVASGYSFESWLLWEWAARCWRHPGWKTVVEPAYKVFTHGKVRSQPRGDLLVSDAAGSQVLIELAIMHDRTGSKWYTAGGKLARDRERLLTQVTPGLGLMQVIVVASAGADIKASPSWKIAFAQSGCWTTTPDFVVDVPLLPDGQVMATGWCI